MPKLRNSKSDLGAFAQWVARKVINHNPLVELAMSDRSKKPNIYKTDRNGLAQIDGRTADKNVIYCFAPGGGGSLRNFRITVEEVGTADLPPLNALESVPS